jgi:hypothetical protein
MFGVSGSSYLLSLPEEIVLKILADGDYHAILACKRVSRGHTFDLYLSETYGDQTCRRMYDVISRSISLCYLLELAANGMKHGSYSYHGKLQCLEMLAAHETAWRTLSWSDNAPVDMLVGWGEPVSVSGNVICFRSKCDLSHEEFLLLRVPSKLRDVTMKSWRLRFPDDVQDVCIDSGQDLLICRRGYVKSLMFRVSVLTAVMLQG